jgi:hypothetical protein
MPVIIKLLSPNAKDSRIRTIKYDLWMMCTVKTLASVKTEQTVNGDNEDMIYPEQCYQSADGREHVSFN